jgi:PPM family protein phosphatase
MKSILACSTASLKEINEDSYCIVLNEKAAFNAIIIADGLGSHKYSERASAFVTTYLKKILEDLTQIDQLDFEDFFKATKLALLEDAKSNTEFNFPELSKGLALSTTLICVIETESKYTVAYVGNGSAWQIRGYFNQFGKSRYLPWNSINLLNPHCVEDGGKSALYRYISIDDAQFTPDIISISKSQFSPGECLMIATDGIYSYDGVIIGKDDEGKIWVSGEETMELFYKKLSALLVKTAPNLSTEDLKLALDEYLQELKDNKLMTDDCTIGIIIPDVVLRYQANMLENKKNLNADETNTAN